MIKSRVVAPHAFVVKKAFDAWEGPVRGLSSDGVTLYLRIGNTEIHFLPIMNRDNPRIPWRVEEKVRHGKTHRELTCEVVVRGPRRIVRWEPPPAPFVHSLPPQAHDSFWRIVFRCPFRRLRSFEQLYPVKCRRCDQIVGARSEGVLFLGHGPRSRDRRIAAHIDRTIAKISPHLETIIDSYLGSGGDVIKMLQSAKWSETDECFCLRHRN